MFLTPSVTVVIPARNEAANLPFVLPQIPEYVREVILVDGHSTDGTPAIARQILSNVRVVEQQGRGKGAALRCGFEAAHGDIVVMLDADGSTDPHEIPAFVEALVHGADLAKGSRFLAGGGTSDMTWLRKLGNAAFVMLVRTLFGGRYTDLCYGYNAVWRRNITQLYLDCDGFEIETMMNIRALKAGLRVTEVPSFEHPRLYGNSNLNAFRDGWRVLSTIMREALSGPPHPHASSESTSLPARRLVAVPMADRVKASSVHAGEIGDLQEELATADSR